MTVVNALPQPSGGTLTLRDLDGRRIAEKKFIFDPHSSTAVHLSQVLTEAGSFVHAGSVTLEQDSALRGPALVAQLSMTLHAGSQYAFLEE